MVCYLRSRWVGLIGICMITLLSLQLARSQQTSTPELLSIDAPTQPHSPLSAGQKVLKTGRYMALTTKEIVKGSCWDYINTVFNRAGYPLKKRSYILRNKKSGPYARVQDIEPGDWMYFINHSYRGVSHSGIFVRWVNKQKRIAEVLSYPGEHRKKPGRYRNYLLSNVFTIIRPHQ